MIEVLKGEINHVRWIEMVGGGGGGGGGGVGG